MKKAAPLSINEAASLALLNRMADHLRCEAHAILEASLSTETRDSKRTYRGTLRLTIWKRDEGRCFYCDRPVRFAQMEIDHVLPWARGGRTVPENGVCSCRPCNRTKSAEVW